MHDRALQYFGDIVEVSYSRDGAKRCVVYRDRHGFFRYAFEEILLYDEDDWAMMYQAYPDELPAWWNEMWEVRSGASIFDDLALLNRARQSEPVWLNDFA